MLRILFFTILLITNNTHAQELPVDTDSVAAGTSVMMRGVPAELYPGSLKVGDDFLALAAATDIDFAFNNKVTLVSFVPSVDTPVCEAQTHMLGAAALADGIERVTFSRDLPMAQQRFAKDASLQHISFVSDYKSGSFGMKTGLLIKGRELLARGVAVLDEQGIVRYLQIVPEVSHLPDMQAAVIFANELAGKTP